MNQKNGTGNLSRRKRINLRRHQAKVRNILYAVAAVVLLAAIAFLSFSRFAAQDVIRPHVGTSLGEFQLQDLSGNTVHLSDYQGKAILINAWATWCPPCKAEMPLLNQYYQSHAKDDFVILAINAGDSQAAAFSFANQSQLQFPVLLDPGTNLLNQLGINSFPTSILIGRNGKVSSVHVGIFTSISIETEVTPLLY